MNSKVLCRHILKAIIFLILFIAFLVFYFVHQTSEFMKGSTTFSTRFEKVETFEMPVLVICFKPTHKANKNSHLRLTEQYLSNQTIDDYLAQSGYAWNQDIQLQFGFDEYGVTNYTLDLGSNNVKDFQVNVTIIKTFALTMCYKIETTWKPPLSGNLLIKLDSKLLSNVHLYLASKESWYSIMAGAWPFTKPIMYDLKFNTFSMIQMDIHVTKWQYKTGHSNIPDCFEDWFSSINCSQKCMPFFVPSNHKRPECQTIKESKCTFDVLLGGESYFKFKNCMKPKETTSYAADPVVVEQDYVNDSSINVIITFASDEVEMKEETLMIGLSSLIGSIGGSLGLFLGFSCFTYLSYCIDKLFDIFQSATTF